ncbi:MAG: SprB repeat-containing protein [Verrucomicrobia bacterium]|nr:SprB repeat-containing protein [Cytophagales bacterium]
MKLYIYVSLFFCFSLFLQAQPQVKATVKNPSCSGKPDGSINLTVNGKAPFTFNWQVGASTQNLEEISAGTYLVTVTDANGRSTQSQVEVKNGSNLQIEIEMAEGSQTQASFRVQMTGGTAPYTYQLSYFTRNGSKQIKQNEGVFNNIERRKYVLDVRDAKGCMTNTSVDLKSK